MSVVSKNPFDLLGDDGDESPAPKAAPKAAAPAETKPKRDIPGAKAPAGGAAAGAARGGRYPSRGAPRNVYKGDRSPPAQDNVPEGTETGVFDGERAPPSRKSNHRGGDAHTKGPRGSRPAKSYTSGGHTSQRSNIGASKTPAQGGERRQFERRSGTIADSQKKVDQGWGANEGSAELTAEVEGQTDAITEEKAEAAGPDAVEADAAPAVEEEPEEVQKSLDEYLAERAAAGLAGIGKKEGRTVTADNLEGSQFVRQGIDEFFHGKEKTASSKPKAAKKEKVFIEFDGQFARPAGEREQRGERREGGAGRGGARGGRGQGPRGGARGGAARGGAQRAPRSQAIDANDTSAFPALGA